MKPLLIIRHVEYERLGWIPEILEELEVPFHSISLALGEFLPPPEEISGMIVMGGPMSAYQTEEYPFFLDEMEYIREVLGLELPILGICLGGQLLAQALGASVTQAASPEIGWLPLTKLENGDRDAFFSQHEVPDCFQLHGDVFDIPKGSVPLIKSQRCAYQAFRVGNRAYGLQFHPETNIPMVESVLEEYRSQLSDTERREIIGRAVEESQKGKAFLKAFLHYLFQS